MMYQMFNCIYSLRYLNDIQRLLSIEYQNEMINDTYQNRNIHNNDYTYNIKEYILCLMLIKHSRNTNFLLIAYQFILEGLISNRVLCSSLNPFRVICKGYLRGLTIQNIKKWKDEPIIRVGGPIYYPCMFQLKGKTFFFFGLQKGKL